MKGRNSSHKRGKNPERRLPHYNRCCREFAKGQLASGRSPGAFRPIGSKYCQYFKTEPTQSLKKAPSHKL